MWGQFFLSYPGWENKRLRKNCWWLGYNQQSWVYMPSTLHHKPFHLMQLASKVASGYYYSCSWHRQNVTYPLIQVAPYHRQIWKSRGHFPAYSSTVLSWVYNALPLFQPRSMPKPKICLHFWANKSIGITPRELQIQTVRYTLILDRQKMSVSLHSGGNSSEFSPLQQWGMS